MEEFVLHLQSLEPLPIYAAVLAIAFIENLFPPSPSDVVILFAGSLVGIGQVDFLLTLLAATTGSCLGFVAMYKVGHWFGHRILEQGKIKFIPLDAVKKAEEWFGRYGYWIIVANRFLAGTRAVVSFFAGLSELNLTKTTLLSFVSALVWNSVLLGLGFTLGKNWQEIGSYLATYSKIATLIVLLAILVVIIRMLYRSRKEGTS